MDKIVGDLEAAMRCCSSRLPLYMQISACPSGLSPAHVIITRTGLLCDISDIDERPVDHSRILENGTWNFRFYVSGDTLHIEGFENINQGRYLNTSNISEVE